MRKITKTYSDPLDLIWLEAARQMGMRIVRSNDVFASWDGKGTLTIGHWSTLDADDCLAQMILHETCHALVEGPEAFELADWGLEIDNPAHRVRELACLRLQAALTSPHGLRQFLAATTNFRRYYDQFPVDPLSGDGDDVKIAAEAMERASFGPWAEILQQALSRTAAIFRIASECAPPDSLWSLKQTPSH